ncbi:MAG: hypothetical protein ABIG44_07445 [Planctomycetota bacterium]
MFNRASLACLLFCLICYPAIAADDEINTDNYGHRALFRNDVPAPPSGGTTTALPDWRALGPFGGDVDDVNVSPTDPNVVLAGIAPDGSSGGTLFRSTDGGATWVEVTTLVAGSVYDIEFAPDGTVYIGTDDGVWKSTSAGVSWTQLPINVGINDTVPEVAIDPNNASNIWAGVTDAMGNNSINVIRSTDAGASWNDVTPPLAAPLTCRGIAFDPGNSNNVYACFRGSFGGGAFWYSSNYGVSWTNYSAGLPSNPLNDIAHDGTRVYVTGGQLFGSQDVGLYASTNHGATWLPLHDGTWDIMAFAAIDLDPNDPSIIYLASLGDGIYRSEDGGSTWEFAAGQTGGLSLNSIRFAPGNSSVIYLGASSIGILRSIDGGILFSPSSVGIGALVVTSVSANPLDVHEIAIAFEGLNNGGIYTTVDSGMNWDLEPVPGTRWSTVGFHPNGTLYALSDGPTTIAPEAFYRRNPDGTWTSIGPDQGTVFESRLICMRFNRHNPNLILGGGADFGVAGFEPTIWISTDAGTSWLKAYEGTINNQNVTDIEIVDDFLGNIMVASYDAYGTPQEGGALRSTDGGYTWNDSSTGLAIEAEGFALSPATDNPFTFFYADGDYGNGGLYKTTNSGQTWSATSLIGERVYDVVNDLEDGQTIYTMHPAGDPVRISTDGGMTFSPFGTLGSIGWVNDLFYAPGLAPRLLLATTTGIYARTLRDVGDMNCDGNINAYDIDGFILAVSSAESYYGNFPDGDYFLGDCNGDGFVNAYDIDSFIDLVGGG